MDIQKRSTGSWVLYDMANTMFSFAIVSLYYPLWITGQGLTDRFFALPNSLAMGFVFLVAPFMGALGDRARRRVPFLAAATLLCVTATAPLGFLPWQASISIYIVAVIGFQLGLIFYDAMLPDVSTPWNRGRIGSIGVAVGYLGSLAAVSLGALILRVNPDGHPFIFLGVAVSFLLLALPAFFFIRETPRPDAKLRLDVAADAARQAYRKLWRVLRGEDKVLRRFLFARILYADAANTMIVFMGIYATREVGFTETEVQGVVVLGILGAVTISWLWGKMVDRVGAKRTLMWVLRLWLVLLAIVALVPVFGWPKEIFWGLAFILGAALGGIHSSDRPLLLALAPPDRVGEYVGFYAMVGRFAAVLGPLTWALVADILGFGRPAAVGVLFVAVLVAFVIARKVHDARPAPS